MDLPYFLASGGKRRAKGTRPRNAASEFHVVHSFRKWNLKVHSGILTSMRFGPEPNLDKDFSRRQPNMPDVFATGPAGKDQEYGRFIFFRFFLLED
jgi:hypothetical protein